MSTSDPPRNFNLTSAARLRATFSGPLAYMRRLRAIEDLEESLVSSLVDLCLEAWAAGEEERAYVGPRAARQLTPALERLAELVDKHNRYYPIEANLGVSPRTGELVGKDGEPWRPLAAPSLDDLISRALARL